MQVRGRHLGTGMLHSHTSQPKSSLSYPIGHSREQYFPRSGQESSARVEGEVVHQKAKGRSSYGAECKNILETLNLAPRHTLLKLTVETVAEQTSIFVLLEAEGTVVP